MHESNMDRIAKKNVKLQLYFHSLLTFYLFSGTRDWTQGLMHATHILYHRDVIPTLIKLVKKVDKK
jgi:hypothetical protein